MLVDLATAFAFYRAHLCCSLLEPCFAGRNPGARSQQTAGRIQMGSDRDLSLGPGLASGEGEACVRVAETSRSFRARWLLPHRGLADALETQSSIDKELTRLFVYASMKSDEDTRVSPYQAMQQEMIQLGSVFGTETAFIEPEILKMDNATIERFVAQEPRLHVFRHYLEDIARRRAHTLSNAEEKLLAGSSVMASGPSSVYGIFADADFPYPSVTLSDGKTVKLDKATFSLYRASPLPRRPAESHGSFFHRAGKISRDLRLHDEFQCGDLRFLRACTQLRELSAIRPGPAQHSGFGVFEAGGRSRSQFAHFPSIPETPETNDGAFRTSLLRSVCSACAFGRHKICGGFGRAQHPGSTCPARPRIRRRSEARVYRAMDRHVSQRGENIRCLFERRELTTFILTCC